MSHRTDVRRRAAGPEWAVARIEADDPAEAVRLFPRAGGAFAPAKAANPGGMATSALEMQQNACRDSWSVEQTERRLWQIMRECHDACRDAGEEYGVPAITSPARMTGFERVADVRPAHGVV